MNIKLEKNHKDQEIKYYKQNILRYNIIANIIFSVLKKLPVWTCECNN